MVSLCFASRVGIVLGRSSFNWREGAREFIWESLATVWGKQRWRYPPSCMEWNPVGSCMGTRSFLLFFLILVGIHSASFFCSLRCFGLCGSFPLLTLLHLSKDPLLSVLYCCYLLVKRVLLPCMMSWWYLDAICTCKWGSCHNCEGESNTKQWSRWEVVLVFLNGLFRAGERREVERERGQ